MIPNNHLLVLSQPDFLHHQLHGVLNDCAPAARTALLRLWGWASKDL